jgi:hypothetical protein
MRRVVYVRSHRGHVLRVSHNPELAEYCAIVRGPDPDRPGQLAVLASYFTDDLVDAIRTGDHELAAALCIPELELELECELAARSAAAP